MGRGERKNIRIDGGEGGGRWRRTVFVVVAVIHLDSAARVTVSDLRMQQMTG